MFFGNEEFSNINTRRPHPYFLAILRKWYMMSVRYPIQYSSTLDSFERILNEIPLKIVYRYLLPLLVSYCKFGISTVSPMCPKYLQYNILFIISTWNSNYLTLDHLQSFPSSLDQASVLNWVSHKTHVIIRKCFARIICN